MKRFMKYGLLTVGLLMLALPAHSTIVRSMNLQQLTKEADVVVHGRVAAQSAAWNEARSRIYTVTEIEVVESLKGDDKPSQTLTIRQIGGTVDGITQTIVGNAKMKVGEEVVLFLDKDEAKPLHYVIGMAQGKYAIDRSAGEPRVVRSLEGLALAEVSGDQLARLKHVDHKTAAAPVRLTDFKKKVRSANR